MYCLKLLMLIRNIRIIFNKKIVNLSLQKKEPSKSRWQHWIWGKSLKTTGMICCMDTSLDVTLELRSQCKSNTSISLFFLFPGQNQKVPEQIQPVMFLQLNPPPGEGPSDQQVQPHTFSSSSRWVVESDPDLRSQLNNPEQQIESPWARLSGSRKVIWRDSDLLHSCSDSILQFPAQRSGGETERWVFILVYPADLQPVVSWEFPSSWLHVLGVDHSCDVYGSASQQAEASVSPGCLFEAGINGSITDVAVRRTRRSVWAAAWGEVRLFTGDALMQRTLSEAASRTHHSLWFTPVKGLEVVFHPEKIIPYRSITAAQDYVSSLLLCFQVSFI